MQLTHRNPMATWGDGDEWDGADCDTIGPMVDLPCVWVRVRFEFVGKLEAVEVWRAQRWPETTIEKWRTE